MCLWWLWIYLICRKMTARVHFIMHVLCNTFTSIKCASPHHKGVYFRGSLQCVFHASCTPSESWTIDQPWGYKRGFLFCSECKDLEMLKEWETEGMWDGRLENKELLVGRKQSWTLAHNGAMGWLDRCWVCSSVHSHQSGCLDNFRSDFRLLSVSSSCSLSAAQDFSVIHAHWSNSLSLSPPCGFQ